MLKLAILPLFENLEAFEPKLVIEPVPELLAIAPGRFYIAIHQAEQTWQAPVQFTEVEARAVASMIKRFNLRLDDDDRPIALDYILECVETVCNRYGLNYQPPAKQQEVAK